MDIAVAATVQCPDGPAGQVTHLVVDRAFMRVTYIVVKEVQRPYYKERMVPFRHVQRSAGNEIHLWCSCQELSTMQPGTWAELVEAEASIHGGSLSPDHSIDTLPRSEEVRHLNLAKTECALGAGTRVRATDGNAGRLAGLTVEPTSGDITHLLFWKGHTRTTCALAMPVAAVAEVGPAAVYVRSTRARIAAMVPHPVWAIRSTPQH